MELNNKQKRILSITLACWGVFLSLSGVIMTTQKKQVFHTKYNVIVAKNKIAQAQAKNNEIKLKNIEIEINNPISVYVKDYLEDIDNLTEETLRSLKLDTSLVNINEAGEYQYTITYKKKKHIGTVKVKEKELPNFAFTLKEINLTVGDSLSSNPRSFINEEIPDEVYNNLTLDISGVNTNEPGKYTYYITYKGVISQGDVNITEKPTGPKIITPGACGNDAKSDGNVCVCIETNKVFDEATKECKLKETTE